MTSDLPLHAHQVALRLARSRHVLITSHASPDGDALGSELALAELCRHLGAKAEIVNRDPHPPNLAFLPGLEAIKVRPELSTEFVACFDLVVVLECPGLDRPGFSHLSLRPLVNIDHHLANELYGEVNFVDPEAPAVGEMLLSVADAASAPLTPTMATCLYTALVTDTGDFRYSNATPRAFRAAARLVEAGAQPAWLAEQLHARVPARVVRLQAEVLSTLELLGQGKLAVITCDGALLQKVGAAPQDTEDLVNIPRSIEGVQVAAFFKALKEGQVKVSLRSRGTVDVQALASRFGGGGHTHAAGLTIFGDLTAARNLLLPELLKLVEPA